MCLLFDVGLQVFDKEGNFQREFPYSPHGKTPYCVAFDSAGNVLIVDWIGSAVTVHRNDADLTKITQFGGRFPAMLEFSQPWSIFIDNDGDGAMYVSGGTNSIQKLGFVL